MTLRPLLFSIRDLLFRMALARAARHYPADATAGVEAKLRRPIGPENASRRRAGLAAERPFGPSA